MTMVDQALKRPLDYGSLDPRDQWEIDKRLGILDWDPTPDEIREFNRRWAEKVGIRSQPSEKPSRASGYVVVTCWVPMDLLAWAEDKGVEIAPHEDNDEKHAPSFWVKLTSLASLTMLAQAFDVMVLDRDGIQILLDRKGGRFKQR